MSSKSFIKLVIFIVVVIVFLYAGRWYASRLDEQAAREELARQEEAVQDEERVRESFIIEDVVLGTGQEAKNNDTVAIHYRGELEDRTSFDNSYDRGQPFAFTLGKGEVIKGMDLGVLGMKVGGKRKIVIPPEWGYGVRGSGPIPPYATLVFTVELIEVNNQ